MFDGEITGSHKISRLEIFLTALRLGLTSFGGPVAHLKIFRNKFVVEKQWISSSQYEALTSLASVIPGPSSSQVGMGIGQYAAGFAGAGLFWLGFTLPSATAMYLISLIPDSHIFYANWFNYLIKIVLLLVVGRAWWSMQAKLAGTNQKRILALVTAAIFSLTVTQILQIASLVLSAFYGSRKLVPSDLTIHYREKVITKKAFGFLISLFLLLALSLLILSREFGHSFDLANRLFQTGALVFGGGHVVLPMLQSRFISTHLISAHRFSLGYLAAQLMPGPLFAFAAFIGASTTLTHNHLLGAIIAIISIFTPGALLMLGGMHYWQQWMQNPKFMGAINGLNAAVVGALLAALINLIRY
jgi:chromate transporter